MISIIVEYFGQRSLIDPLLISIFIFLDGHPLFHFLSQFPFQTTDVRLSQSTTDIVFVKCALSNRLLSISTLPLRNIIHSYFPIMEGRVYCARLFSGDNCAWSLFLLIKQLRLNQGLASKAHPRTLLPQSDNRLPSFSPLLTSPLGIINVDDEMQDSTRHRNGAKENRTRHK